MVGSAIHAGSINRWTTLLPTHCACCMRHQLRDGVRGQMTEFPDDIMLPEGDDHTRILTLMI